MATSHWVERLYPVHFSYQNHEELTKPIEEVRTMLDGLLDRVTSVNTESIRDIYINVLAMVTAEQRTSSAPVTRMVDISTQTDLSALMTDSLSIRVDASNGGEIKDKNLWTSMEQQLLRDHYMRQHEEYLNTRTELVNVKNEDALLTEQCKRVKKDLIEKSDEVLAKDASINRLKEVNKGLREEIESIMRQLTDSETELHHLKIKYKLKSSEQLQASTRLNEIAIKHKLLEVKLKKVHEAAAVDADRQIAAMKLKFDTEVADLTDRINNLTESLNTEQELHNRCKKGLEALRLHFSQSNNVQSLVDNT